ncbi:MAG: KH domain-containing protein [Fimbriimonadaceae bacterium]|nr:KH domain-containing protein [Fimbriimonadaceae bacterium]
MANNTVETTAASLAEARKIAAEQLGVAEDTLQVTVLDESKGLFGRGQVRIRAEAAAVKEAATAVVDAEPPAEAEKPKARRTRTKKVEEPVEEAAAEPEPAAEKPARKARAPRAEAKSEADKPADEQDRAEAVATAKDGKAMLALVEEMLASADLEITAKVAGLQGRYVNIELDGRDVGHLIGKHGEVLNASQYLANIIASRKFDNGVRIVLDGANYRTKREEALTGLATKIAEQVLARGEEAVLDALPAFERRIVHKALSEIEGITTYSEGEEPNRRVVIAPAE